MLAKASPASAIAPNTHSISGRRKRQLRRPARISLRAMRIPLSRNNTKMPPLTSRSARGRASPVTGAITASSTAPASIHNIRSDNTVRRAIAAPCRGELPLSSSDEFGG